MRASCVEFVLAGSQVLWERDVSLRDGKAGWIPAQVRWPEGMAGPVELRSELVTKGVPPEGKWRVWIRAGIADVKPLM